MVSKLCAETPGKKERELLGPQASRLHVCESGVISKGQARRLRSQDDPGKWVHRKGDVKMQNSLEETTKSKRQIKRALIVFAVVEFVVTVFVMFFMVKK